MALGRVGLQFLAGLASALLAYTVLETTRPTLLLVGNVTVDVVEGKKALGGAVSYAAAVAAAMGVRACVVTANDGEADLSLFKDHDLHVVLSNATLTFEHTYTFWGNRRKLRVTKQPNVTLTMQHVPWHCRRARVVLLGPLMPEDMDPASFVNHQLPAWDRLLGARQQVGLMAQGLQRALDSGKKVYQLKEPSQQLKDALGPHTAVFLSDVEADVWTAGAVEELAQQTQVFLVTRGSDGADEYTPGARRRYPIFQVDGVVDTNGAGDSFATGWMLAAARGHSSPTAVANWAGAMAVSQPQSCKPACVGDAARSRLEDVPPSDGQQHSLVAQAAALLEQHFGVSLGPILGRVEQQLGPSLAAARAALEKHLGPRVAEARQVADRHLGPRLAAARAVLKQQLEPWLAGATELLTSKKGSAATP
ncbi:hypothetical protein N2152v2_001329 [Parachlorella kessleri]